MTRTFAIDFAVRLFRHAASEKYPTRSVEYMLAWMMLVWSFSCFLPGEMLVGPAVTYIVALAPEGVWASFGIVTAVMRLVGLMLNGGYKPSPMLRFVGAAMGLNWWLVLFVLYTVSVSGGAPDFPMRRVFLVFVFFEAYSCFRCGQDHAAMKLKHQCEQAVTAACATPPAGPAGHG